MTRADVLLINGVPCDPSPRIRPPDPPGPPQRPGCYPSCCGTLGAGNGGHYTDMLHRAGDCEYHPRRTFDHLDGTEPESRSYSAIARQMRRGILLADQQGPLAWWQTVPERDEPAAVAGEVTDSRTSA